MKRMIVLAVIGLAAATALAILKNRQPAAVPLAANKDAEPVAV